MLKKETAIEFVSSEIQFLVMFQNYLIISSLRSKRFYAMSFLWSGHWWVTSTKWPHGKNPTRSFLKKKPSPSSICVFFCCEKNDLLSDSIPVKKICFQALGPFSNEFSDRIFFIVSGILWYFLQMPCFIALICIAKWHCIRGASLLQWGSPQCRVEIPTESFLLLHPGQHSTLGLAPNHEARRSTSVAQHLTLLRWFLSHIILDWLRRWRLYSPTVGTTSRLSIWTLHVCSWSHSE